MVNDDNKSEDQPVFSSSQLTPHRVVIAQPLSVSDLRPLTFQCMQDGFSVVDTTGIHIDVNPAFCAMTGFSASELIGRGAETTYWPPEEHENIQRLLGRAMLGEFAEIQLTFMRKGGERFQVLLNPFAIRDSKDIISCYATTVKDITPSLQLQSALRDSEERYRGLFQTAGDAIMLLKDDQLVDCNDRALQLTGRSREDLLSNSTVDYFPPTQPNGQDSLEFFAEKVAASRSGHPQKFEWTDTKPDGSIVNTEVSLTTTIVDGISYTQSVIRDTTQRKKTEDALMASEMRFRTLFESAGDSIVIMDSDKFVDCNRSTLRLYGRSRDDIFSNPSDDLFPPTQPNGQNSRQYITEKIEASRSGKPQFFEWTGKYVDGTPIETEITMAGFTIDGKLYTQSIVRDISRRKQMERALQDSEMRFRLLFENAGDSIVILKGNKIIGCNARTLELYGHSREEIIHNPANTYFPLIQPNGQDSLEFFQDKVDASRSGTPQIFEWVGRRPDGTTVWTEVTLSAFMIDGESFSQSIGRDITLRKNLQASLLELNRNLEDRVLQRTAELDSAYTELLQRNIDYRALAKKLTQAEEDERKRIARRLHDDHQQLLVAAKLKAELLVTQLYGSDVNAVGAQIVEILEQALDVTRSLTMELAPPIIYGAGFVAAMQWLSGWMEEHHQLEVRVIGALPVTPVPPEVSNLLFRAVRELLFNVSKHSGVRQASVNIVAFDQGLRVVVTDEGCGFNVEDVLQTPRSYGLFSIREQLTALDGLLELSSVLQRGTTCTVSIPVPAEDVMDAEALSGTEPIAAEITEARYALPVPIRILVADDHALSRNALVQILSLIDDFEIVGEAVDGLDAVEQTRLLRPDVVLMDATMPRLNGPEAIRCIIAELPAVKVIGLSMHVREDMETKMIAAGATSYMQKLTPVEDLFSCIRGVMDKGVTGAP